MTFYNNLLEEYTKRQWGYAPLAIIGQSCLGSAAVLLILMNDSSKWILLGQLFLVTILCMGFNAAILSQQTAKIAFNTLLISVASSTLLILIHLFR